MILSRRMLQSMGRFNDGKRKLLFDYIANISGSKRRQKLNNLMTQRMTFTSHRYGQCNMEVSALLQNVEKLGKLGGKEN